MPGSGGVAHRTPDDLRGRRAPLAPLAAVVLAGVWMILAPRTPDLAAQVYRVNLFDHAGFTVWDERWYAGHDLPGYSLLLGPLASVVGLRVVGLLSVVASAALFERLALRFYGPGARWGAVWFAVAVAGDVWIGRVTFALGVPFALAAVLALAKRRPLLAAVLAALSAAASPVAGALLGIAAVTRALTPPPTPHDASATPHDASLTPHDASPTPHDASLTPHDASPREGEGRSAREPHDPSVSSRPQAGRSPPLRSRRSARAVLLLAVPAAAVVASMALLFPEGGSEPFPIVSFAVTAAVSMAFLLGLPPGSRLERTGAIVFVLACVLCLLVRSPIGSNVERYAVLLAGPLLLCAHARSAATGTDPVRARPGRALFLHGDRGAPGSPAAGVLAACAIAVWVAWGPVRETAAVAGNESTRASYYAPVERFLATRGAGQVRVEVPLTRLHWESAWLAPSVSLARGWEKQLDERYDRVLLEPGLTASAYSRWLHEQAVAYVALPDTPLDPSSAREGHLIRAGLPYLSEVLSSAHWRIYAVRAATPIVAAPARLLALGHDSFTVRADSAKRILVRVRYTRYFTVTRGDACVSRAPGGWTAVTSRAAGEVNVIARFSLARAVGVGGACTTRLSARTPSLPGTTTRS